MSTQYAILCVAASAAILYVLFGSSNAKTSNRGGKLHGPGEVCTRSNQTMITLSVDNRLSKRQYGCVHTNIDCAVVVWFPQPLSVRGWMKA